jgi:tetratricopeptide (TPR) repeat protein
MPKRLEMLNQTRISSYKDSLANEERLAKTALQNTNNLTADDPRKLAAQETLADVYWRYGKTPEAENLYGKLCDFYKKHRNQAEYDQKWVNVTLKLAGLLRDTDRLNPSQALYEEILKYDQEQSRQVQSSKTIGQERLARDYDNLGVNLYLFGQAQPIKQDRENLWRRSKDCFEHALELARSHFGANSQYEANILSNQYLVLRDLGLEHEANLAKRRSDKIAALVQRPCLAP